MTRWLLVPAFAFGLGCASQVSTQMASKQAPPKLEKLAVLPLTIDPAPGGVVEVDSAAIVTTRVVEALTRETRFAIVPPGEVMRGVPEGEVPSGDELRRQFGVDGVVTGTLRRYRKRVGGPAGAFKPASVWFTIEVRTTDGTRVWSGTYEETQRALSEDLGSLPRAWRRGFKWVTAARLSQEGADELARALDEDTEPWS